MRWRIILIGVTAVGLAPFLFFNSFTIVSPNVLPAIGPLKLRGTETVSTTPVTAKLVLSSAVQDIEPQPQLQNPPNEIKAVYSTAWSASSQQKIKYFIDLIDSTELNAIVIDVKDYTGEVAYNTKLEDVIQYGARTIKIPRLNALIKQFHDKNIYVIARISVFQDPILAKARPDLAVKNGTSSKIWYDRKGLAWADPSSKEVWDYNLAIAKEVASRGVDEVNFDYIRFPSDGNVKDMVFSHYDKTLTHAQVIRNFYRYVREQMEDAPAKTSADLFGLTTVNKDDLGIGQVIESAYANFDYVAPMVYPSHYASGFHGYTSPAQHPYEVVKYSMDRAFARLATGGLASASTGTPAISYNAKLRPWLQDFDLGATYDATKVRAQIQAVYDAADAASQEREGYNGWMLWSARNIYTKGALQ